MGLVGTVIGFIIALSGVDATAATDPGAIAPMVSTLLLGMAIALYKTLVGTVLNIWLMFNYRLLESGSVHLDRPDVIERGREPMHGFDGFEHDDAGVVFRDLITLCLCGFIACVVLMLPHINPARAAAHRRRRQTPATS